MIQVRFLFCLEMLYAQGALRVIVPPLAYAHVDNAFHDLAYPFCPVRSLESTGYIYAIEGSYPIQSLPHKMDGLLVVWFRSYFVK